jgi:hypothetical protein
MPSPVGRPVFTNGRRSAGVGRGFPGPRKSANYMGNQLPPAMKAHQDRIIQERKHAGKGADQNQYK